GGGGCVVFSDDFEDGTITGWTSIGSEPLVETGGVLQTPEGNNQTSHYSIDSGTGWTDYSISADVKSVDNDVSGITFRIQDHDNIYLFRQEFGEGGSQWDCQLQKYVAAVRSDLAPPVPNFGTDPGQVNDVNAWYNMKVVVSGTNIKCYIDDVLKFDVDDSTYSQGTGGLWLAAQVDSEFDNALVESGSCATISSDSDQAFGVGDAATAISPITVTDDATPLINFNDDIRIRIPAGFNMTWDTTDTQAVVTGPAASNVSTTVAYEEAGKTLVIDVTTSFGASDEITVSGLSFTGFSADSPQDNLELDVDNDAMVHATDDKTIQVGPSGNTYYVRATGSDAADGLSPASAWLTVDKAADTMVAGDWVYVGAGVYDEQVTPTNDGTAAEPIRFVADTDGSKTGDAGTVEITDSGGFVDVVRVEDDDYIELVGFKITGGVHGIRWLNSVGGLVDQCEVAATGDRGISVETGSELTVTGCDVHHCTNEGIYPWGGATLTITETDIRNNGKFGMRVVDAGTTMTASRCWIADNDSDGARIEEGDVTMVNCLVTGNLNKAIYVLPGPATTTLWHCTIDNNSHDGFKQDSGTAVIRNCIITNNGQSGIELVGGTVDHTYNLVWNNSTNYTGTSAHGTELSEDPLFISATDRHLQSSSPAIDVGTDGSSVTTLDFDGDGRPGDGGWDMGYDEYGQSLVVVISSDANQAFGVSDPITAISPITVTDAATPLINFIDDIRITIPAGFNMTWDTTDTEAVVTGPAASNVSTTVTYEDSGQTLVINVTTSFAASDRIRVTGLSFTGFSAGSASDNLELDVDNDGTADVTDGKTIQVGPSGNTYYVRVTGDDLADGQSAANAWRNVDKAANTLAAGDWVYVGAGVYDEQVTPTNDGTAANPIRFIADTDGSRTGDAGTVEITDSTGTLDVLQITGNDYFEFIGFKITGGGIMARWENCVGGLLKDCELTAGDRAIRLYGTAELTITGSEIHTNTSSAVYVYDSSTITISDTLFHNNTAGVRDDAGAATTITLDRCEFYSHSKPSVYAFTGTYTVTNCLIHSNTSRAIGLEPEGAGPNVTIWHCTIDDNQDEGISQQAGTSTIRNCIISNNGQAGLDLVSGTMDHTYNLVWNNSPDYVGTVSHATELSVAPLFVSAADRHLQSGSPARNVGTDGTSMTTVDFDGDGRPEGAGWDMGCDEYGQATTGTPTIVGWREVKP
ncbi:MAG: right-handed parallel beta-helix repeat-containing protein, partial [Planctomycetota bacterium]